MKTITKSEIPTCDYTWNPVRGCNNVACPVHPRNPLKVGTCWASIQCRLHAKPWMKAENAFNAYLHNIGKLSRKDWNYAVRLNWETDFHKFLPVWFESQYQKKFPKQQSRIFVGSQSDCSGWEKEWWEKILEKIETDNQERIEKGFPLHVFQFLTKKPEIYLEKVFPENCWLGFTAWDRMSYLENIKIVNKLDRKNLYYAYFEPLLWKIELDANYLGWVVVGGLSGKSSYIYPDWVREIRDFCTEFDVPFYFKSWGKEVSLSQVKADEKKQDWLDGKQYKEFPAWPGEPW